MSLIKDISLYRLRPSSNMRPRLVDNRKYFLLSAVCLFALIISLLFATNEPFSTKICQLFVSTNSSQFSRRMIQPGS